MAKFLSAVALSDKNLKRRNKNNQINISRDKRLQDFRNITQNTLTHTHTPLFPFKSPLHNLRNATSSKNRTYIFIKNCKFIEK
jgi:hypothetical protein